MFDITACIACPQLTLNYLHTCVCQWLHKACRLCKQPHTCTASLLHPRILLLLLLL